MKLGDKSNEIREWQIFLNARGERLIADGNFGPMTKAATQRFQDAFGLRPDGIVGENTLREAERFGFGVEPVLVEKEVAEPGGTVLFEGTKVGKINAAMLAKVAPTLQRRGVSFIEAAAADGVTVQIVQGLRTIAEQDALFAKGRTAPGKKVTNARGGFSNHNFGCALDFAPVIDGVVSWDEKLYKSFGEWADIAVLDWGGRWARFVDLPHVQLKDLPKTSVLREWYKVGGLAEVWRHLD